MRQINKLGFAACALAMAACSSAAPAATASATSAPEQTASGTDVSSIRLADTKNLVKYSKSILQQMDYVVTGMSENHTYNANFVDGLLENDQYGNVVPCLAESYDVNEDATVFTFHLREGVTWVTSTGESYEDLTAEDFVTGLRHGVEFNSNTAWLLDGVVKGYSEYASAQDFSDEAFEKVGIKALDAHTVEYTLEQSAPYFPSMTTYTVLFPINREFLETKGEGCKLGTPDLADCDFGTTAADSILYNGGFILDSSNDGSSTVIRKNESYWDAEHIYIDSATFIYDDGSDPYSGIRSFEEGIYNEATINAQWEDFDSYMSKYEGYTQESLPNASAYGIIMNLNRQVYENTGYATDSALAENTHAAMLNENFRKALRASFDRQAYLETNAPEVIAKASIRNIDNDPNCVRTSDGTSYGDLVTAAYQARTGTDVDLSDGQDPFYSKESALAYIEAAKSEGIEFPVHLDMLVPETDKTFIDKSMSLKQSIEETSDGNILIELVMRDEDTVKNICRYNQDPANTDYDISTYSGWGPDYADPRSFAGIFSPVNGTYMKLIGMTSTDNEAYGSDDDIKELVGLGEYGRLYAAADAITDDLDARYRAFAEADAELVDTCFFAPFRQSDRSIIVTHVVPFSKVYALTGVAEFKLKGLRLQEEVVTAEQYQTAYEKWSNGEPLE